MYRPRIIPVLLLKDSGLVKSVRFRNCRYIGDPINAVRIFNDLKADELALLDISATPQHRTIPLDMVRAIGEEANMPFSVGGGITSLEEIRRIIESGAEKVILNTIAGIRPSFIHEAVREFGSSTIVACLDVKKNLWGKQTTWLKNGSESTGRSPTDVARQMEDLGAGEILIQSIERDGMMNGYDIALVKMISDNVTIPVVALGGAGGLDDMSHLLRQTVVNGLAAGSLFVYHGERRAVLVNYPDYNEILKTLT